MMLNARDALHACLCNAKIITHFAHLRVNSHHVLGADVDSLITAEPLIEGILINHRPINCVKMLMLHFRVMVICAHHEIA